MEIVVLSKSSHQTHFTSPPNSSSRKTLLALNMGLGLYHYRKINKKYRIMEMIGAGSTTEVYRVKDRDGTLLAAKFATRRYRFFLGMENKVMEGQIRNNGIPNSHFFGRHGNKYVLVMDMMGNSLASIKQRIGTFSVKSGLLAGIQMTTCLQSIHEAGFVHRNIRPDNFLTDLSQDNSNNILLANYKKVISFQDPDGSHRLPTWGLSFQGSKNFASRHAHNGERQSRRCDIESVIYVIIYLMKGLPWDHLSLNDLSRIANMKQLISAEELCGGLPWEIMMYYRDVLELEYYECPDYSALRGYLTSALYRNGHTEDGDVDWIR